MIFGSGVRWKGVRVWLGDQAARNVSGHVQRPETEMQGMVRMHQMASCQQTAGKAVDWISIRRAVLRSRPPYAENLDDLVSFLATPSGGTDGKFLLFVQAFYR